MPNSSSGLVHSRASRSRYSAAASPAISPIASADCCCNAGSKSLPTRSSGFYCCRFSKFTSSCPRSRYATRSAGVGSASHLAAELLKNRAGIEMTHVPLALCGILAGWARWLELRLDPPASRIAAWVWPVCLTLVGIILILYREA